MMKGRQEGEDAGLECPAQMVGLVFPDLEETEGDLDSHDRLGATLSENLFSLIIRHPMGMM
jgi:hypothetical protein